MIQYPIARHQTTRKRVVWRSLVLTRDSLRQRGGASANHHDLFPEIPVGESRILDAESHTLMRPKRRIQPPPKPPVAPDHAHSCPALTHTDNTGRYRYHYHRRPIVRR